MASNWKRASKKNVCPICGHDGWCATNRTYSSVICNRPGQAPAGWICVKEINGGRLFKKIDTNPYANATAADLRRKPSQEKPKDQTQEEEPVQEETGSGQADLGLYHAVYTDFLNPLELNPVHLVKLTDPNGSRRLSKAEVKAVGVKSLPGSRKAHRRLISKLLNKYSRKQILTVPGFYQDELGNVRINAGPGLIIPSTADGKITGLRIRTDDGGKYYWLSSTSKGGPGSVSRASVYFPLGGVREPGRVGITEGEFKGFIAAQRLGYPFISVPGISMWETAGALEQASKLAGSAVVVTIFYDMEENQQTNLQKFALADALCKAGHQVELAEWPRENKGIDDLLNAGGTFKTYRYIPGFDGLKADVVLDLERLDSLHIDYSKKATMIRSAMGTGKTYQLTHTIKNCLAKGGRVYVVGHRVSLLRKAAADHGLEFYQDFTRGDTKNQRDMSKVRNLAITLDSLLKLDTGKIKRLDLLVLDESEQVLRHLTGNTIKDNRYSVLKTLAFLIKIAKKVIFLDAGLGYVSNNYLKRLVESDQIQTVINVHQPTKKTFIQYEKKNALLQAACEKIEAGQRPLITTNSKKAAKIIQRMLETEFPSKNGWTIHSHTIGRQEEQEKIARINDVIGNYDFVVTSPSLGTGISIDVDSIDSVFLLAEGGVNTHLDLLQQVSRVRKPSSNEVHCWIANTKRDLPTDPALIKKSMVQNSKETGMALDIDQLTGERIVALHEQNYFELLADITAVRNLSWQDLRANFFKQVELDGHEVRPAGDADRPAKEFKDTSEAYKAAKEELKIESAEGILNAPDIPDYQYKTFIAKPYITEEERHQVHRHSLQRFYNLPIEADLIEQDDEGRIRPKLINLLSFSSPGYAKEKDRREHIPKPGKEQRMLGDTGNHYIKAKMRREVLEKAGLLNEESFFQTFNLANLKDIGFDLWVQQERERLERGLGMRIRTEQAIIKLVTGVLGHLGLEPECTQRRTGETYIDASGKKKEVRVRDYRVSREQYEQVLSLAEAHLNSGETRNQAAREEEELDQWNLAA